MPLQALVRALLARAMEQLALIPSHRPVHQAASRLSHIPMSASIRCTPLLISQQEVSICYTGWSVWIFCAVSS